MKKSLVVVALVLAMVLSVGGICGYALLGDKDGKVEAGGGEETSGAAETEEASSEESEADANAKVQEFEETHSYGSIQDEAIAEYLDKLEIPYTTGKDGQLLVSGEESFRTLKPSEDTARAHSSVQIGLSKTNISDAVEFAFSTLNDEDVKNILAAEAKGFNTTVPMSDEHLAELVREDQRNMVTNVVKGIGHVEQIKDLHYGKSRTVYELSSAVAFLHDETDKAFKTKDADGELIGMNRWLQKVDGKWYLAKDYLVNILPVVAQITEGAEISVKVIYAEKNWGLYRADNIQLRRCELSTEPDDKAAIEYRHYFKDGALMERPSTNIRDQRPEIPAKVPKQVVEESTPKQEPPAQQKRPSGGTISKQPSSNTGTAKQPSSDTETKKAKAKPKSGVAQKQQPQKQQPQKQQQPKKPDKDQVEKPKDEKQIPENRPKDDKGPGEYEPEPKVKKSEVQGLQYQPQADPQTSGTSTTKDQLTKNGTVDNGNGTSTTSTQRVSEGGQTVVDQKITDNKTGEVKEFIENAEAETKPIGDGSGYTKKTEDDAKNGNASTNSGTVQRR